MSEFENVALKVENLQKRFGDSYALKGVFLSVESGKTLGLIGPNGAGKSTLLRCIMNMLIPDGGDIQVLGHPPGAFARSLIGYLPEERGLYMDMKVSENMQFFGELAGVYGEELNKRINSWLSRVDMVEAKSRKIRDCSKGMQQKIQLGISMLHQPDVLVLDEPFSGLDPVSRHDLADIILEEKKRGLTLIFSTHVMQQAEEICDSLALIDHGEIVVSGPLKKVRQDWSPRAWRVTGKTAPPDVIPGFKWQKNEDGWLIEASQEISPETFARDLLEALLKAEYVPETFERVLASLDEIFLKAVKKR